MLNYIANKFYRFFGEWKLVGEAVYDFEEPIYSKILPTTKIGKRILFGYVFLQRHTKTNEERAYFKDFLLEEKRDFPLKKAKELIRKETERLNRLARLIKKHNKKK